MMFHLLFVYSYLSYGIIMIILKQNVITLFISTFILLFKITTNYRFDFTYLECKLRDIKRKGH